MLELLWVRLFSQSWDACFPGDFFRSLKFLIFSVIFSPVGVLPLSYVSGGAAPLPNLGLDVRI